MNDDLAGALRSAASAVRLLVASDYDGVLAPIVAHPAAALPDAAALDALRTLAAIEATHAAVVSGRTVADLRAVAGEPDGVVLLGSHGVEATSGDILSTVQLALRDAIATDLRDAGSRFDGSWVEVKPAGVAFHYRNVSASQQEAAAQAALSTLHLRPELNVMEGKKLVEVTLADGNKGTSLDGLRRALDADVVVFLGDDVTDEHAFVVLEPGDVGIKVGPEPSAAQYRIPAQTDVAEVLTTLADVRSRQ